MFLAQITRGLGDTVHCKVQSRGHIPQYLNKIKQSSGPAQDLSSRPAYQGYVSDLISKINPSNPLPPKTMTEWTPLRLELEPELYCNAYIS